MSFGAYEWDAVMRDVHGKERGLMLEGYHGKEQIHNLELEIFGEDKRSYKQCKPSYFHSLSTNLVKF